jgi:hypothetical protein
MLKFLALIVAGAVAYVPHLLFGDALGVVGDYVVGTIVGGVAYFWALKRLRQLRGDIE